MENVLEATDRFALSRDLRARGLLPLSITEKDKSFSDKFSEFSANIVEWFRCLNWEILRQLFVKDRYRLMLFHWHFIRV